MVCKRVAVSLVEMVSRCNVAIASLPARIYVGFLSHASGVAVTSPCEFAQCAIAVS